MIHLLYGENYFLKRQRLGQLIDGVEPEWIDGDQLSVGQLTDLLLAQDLFSEKRTIVIKNLSQNSETWTALAEAKIGDHITLILFEDKPDKRTKTYKALQKTAKVEQFEPFSDRQKPQLIKWLLDTAKSLGLKLSSAQAGSLIDRLGYDQARLSSVLQQLSLADEINDQLLEDIVPLPKSENVFDLFSAALDGHVKRVHEIISYLESTSGDDSAYQTMGLLVSQLYNLNALKLADGDASAVASDFSVNPYVLRKLSTYARKLSVGELAAINQALTEADLNMKSTTVSPWLLVEVALVSISQK